ncbi:MAG: BrnT family toxin [Bdellovibrionales bacterium]|nr:BrnT family toxin [Bdellovibrionales bacterium]
MVKLEFEWSDSKNQLNQIKHGVSFEEAITCFSDEQGFQLKNAKHSLEEARYYWVGKSSKARILSTYYTIRASHIRIIGSAEWRKFRRLYYERAKNK